MNSENSKLKRKKERNRRQRLEFVKLWARYVRDHEDEEWSRQQNTVIDSQISDPGVVKEE